MLLGAEQNNTTHQDSQLKDTAVDSCVNESVYIGEGKANTSSKEVNGKEVKIGGESFYKIANVDGMRPFFMSIVSHSDHWMFISSRGSLSAGRKNSNNALFLIIQMIRLQSLPTLLGANPSLW